MLESRKQWIGCALVALATSVGAQAPPCPSPNGELLTADRDPGFQFGSAIDVEGGTAVVGAELADGTGMQTGSAYVFEESNGVWQQVTELVGPDSGFLDYFGSAVAIDGDRIVVGASDAPSAPPNPVALSGAAYVFERSGTDWAFAAKLAPPDPVLLGYFGISVDVAGDVVAVGAWNAQTPAGRAGAVYVYELAGSDWLLTQKVVASDAALDARFGYAVVLEGTDLLVGAPQDSGLCPTDPFCEVGAVYVLEKSLGLWTELAKLTPPDFADEDHFGIAVHRADDTVVIGTESSSGVGGTAGSAYVYDHGSGTWSFQQKLEPSDLVPGDRFGASVAVDGQRIVVGAPGDDTMAPEAGSWYLFERTGSIWTQAFEASFAGSEVSTNLGARSALRGDDAFVTAPKDEHAGSVFGSVQLYRLVGDRQVYCTAKQTSLGCLPSVGVSGTPGLGDGVPLSIDAASVPPIKNGLLFYGLNGPAASVFQGGLLCTKPPLRRTTIQTSGPGAPPDPCSGTYAFDLDAWIVSGSDPALGPGVRMNVQYWFRDPGDGFGVGLSDAAELTLCL